MALQVVRKEDCFLSTPCHINLIIEFSQAILPEDCVEVYSGDNRLPIRYSWSTDRVCWSGWYEEESFKSLLTEGDLYVRVWVKSRFDRVVVGCDVITADLYKVYIKPQDFHPEACAQSTFNPYNNLDCALLLQQQLADNIICMLGIPVYYFKCDPDKESIDWTFKEYTLHSITDMKELKLMIPDGEMPSSNPRLTEFDFDWQPDWEVELSKTQFAVAFGDQAIPKQRDFLYIPMMKRMWEVNAAYDEKSEGLMWRSTTWKLALVKYIDSNNFHESKFDDLVDSLLEHQYALDITPQEQEEQERETAYNALSSPKRLPDNLYDVSRSDAVRKSYTPGVKVEDRFICNKGVVVSRNIYKMSPGDMVVYQVHPSLSQGTLSGIIVASEGYISIGDQKVECLVEEGVMYIGCYDMAIEVTPGQVYMFIYSWNCPNQSHSFHLFGHQMRTDIPLYRQKPEMGMFGEMQTAYGHCIEECIGGEIVNTLSSTNIKLYRGIVEPGPEFFKHLSNHPDLIFSDLARPFNLGLGFKPI